MIVLEHGPGGPALFDGAVAVHAAHDRGGGRARFCSGWIRRGRRANGWQAIWPTRRVMRLSRGLRASCCRKRTPAGMFGVFDAPQPVPACCCADPCGWLRSGPWSRAGPMTHAFDRVKAYIAAGDCYQVNLTFPLETRLLAGTALGPLWRPAGPPDGWPWGLCRSGRGPVLVSRSPELFLRLEASGRIEARPMKGTAPRGQDPVEDAELAEGLRQLAKDRAENLMIVDLLRNDIARISRVGSVKVPELFHVESYATVHQMVSRVTGQLAAPATLAGRDAGAVSLRVDHRRAEDPRDGDHPRGRSRPARGLLRRDRLDGTGRGCRLQRGDPDADGQRRSASC